MSVIAIAIIVIYTSTINEMKQPLRRNIIFFAIFPLTTIMTMASDLDFPESGFIVIFGLAVFCIVDLITMRIEEL